MMQLIRYINGIDRKREELRYIAATEQARAEIAALTRRLNSLNLFG